MAHYRLARPVGGLVLALTGTDVYRDIHEDEVAQQSLALADRLVVLQPGAMGELTVAQRAKCDVVFQSAPSLKPTARHTRHFEVIQAGHLRHEKDPFTPITALRMLPSESLIRLTHIGTALDDHHADTMRIVTRDEPRLKWLGGLSRSQTRQRIKRAHMNALENAVPFFVIALIYTQTDPGMTMVRVLFFTFVAVRILHALFYLNAKQPVRTMVFGIGALVNIIMAVQVIRAVI